MRILSIETSCDETAISLVQADGEFPHATYEILGNALWSQVDIHREYGGVMPSVGKREHINTITPLLEKVIVESELEASEKEPLTEKLTAKLEQTLTREEGLAQQLVTFHNSYGKFDIDLIAVTSGPGLEPALWVGVNFAKALALLWDVPVVPTNHMEGHILASIYDVDRDDQLADIEFPALSLLISGGHTEFILMNDWGHYKKIGQTLDDAVGEAFDKVARMLGLPYPGGPEISKHAALARKRKLPAFHTFPVPMIGSGDLNFSFSGLKTAVRYAVQDKELSANDIAAVARDFEDVVAEVLRRKSTEAVDQYGAKTLVVGGGVSANREIKRVLETSLLETNPDVTVFFPPPGLSTDNSIMIALAGHAHAATALTPEGAKSIQAEGNKKHRKIPIGDQIL
ncbi:MAG: tRNA (adenosine(37)-N6)-threonylcarbamoyltransferase complex transferase subunit TsaD [Bacteroidota bacterium]